VHPELLRKQRLPEKLITPDIWAQRFEDISNFELYLSRNGILPLKFFLNISKQEQLRRLLARIDDPEKRWKFQARDVEERKLWDDYMEAYEQTIRHTATKHAPWYVVPADHKWFTRLVVAAALVEQMEKLDLKFPKFDEGNLDELARIRAELAAQLPANKKA
jgi:polyphosphate kinase 2 (PPK2 family)